MEESCSKCGTSIIEIDILAKVSCFSCKKIHLHLNCLEKIIHFLPSCHEIGWKALGSWKCLPCKLCSNHTKEKAEKILLASKNVLENKISISCIAEKQKIPRDILLDCVRWRNVLTNIDTTTTPQKSSNEWQTMLMKIESGRKRKLYDRKVIKWAMDFAEKEKYGCRRAARAAEKHFGLPTNSFPHSTLHKYMSGKSKEDVLPGAKRKISPFEEELAKHHLIMLQMEGKAQTRHSASIELVTMLTRRGRENPFKKCRNELPSEGFWKGFLKRHPQISFSSNRSGKNQIK